MLRNCKTFYEAQSLQGIECNSVTKVISIANHKGGVGKTATCHALGATLARDHGRRVLMVDIDPQGSLSAACGFGEIDDDRSLTDVLGDVNPGAVALRDVIVEVAPGLYLAPADLRLSNTELGLHSRFKREEVLSRALGTVAGFDVVLIDCPPSLSLLTVNALAASDTVITPTQPQPADLRGLKLFIQSLDRVREAINPKITLLGVLVTFYDGRLTLHRQLVDHMREAGLPVFDVMIGRSVRVAESPASGESVTTYASDNPQAEAYKRLGDKIDTWLKS